MAQPPEEPPEDLFGEGAPESGDRYAEPPEEPGRESPEESSYRYSEPPGGPLGESSDRYLDDAPTQRPHGPPDHRQEDEREEPVAWSSEPPQELPADPPREPPRHFGEAGAEDEPPRHPPSEAEDWRSHRHDSTPEWPGGDGENPPEPSGSPEHPAGERFDDHRDDPTGELYGDDADAVPHERRLPPPAAALLGDLGEEVHSSSELAGRRAQERAQRRRAGRQRLAVLVGGLVVVIVVIVLLVGGGSSPTTTTTTHSSPLAAAGTGAGHLLAGSSTQALSANILVADRNNNRLIALTPQGRVAWTQHLTGPSAAFLSPTARSITVTQPGTFVVLQLAVADRKAFYRYGRSGHPGSSHDELRDPGTAQELSDGKLVIADKSSCRILFLTPPKRLPTATLGTPGSCVHDPPKSLAYPVSVFPAFGGGIVVTETDPNWVDVLSPANAVVAAMQVPGLSVPDDAYEYAKDKLIATSRTHPGAVEEFDTADKVTWTYDPTSGTGELDRPSMAEVLADGDVLVCDSGNDRVVVIDPQTDTIIWQYGHTGHPGSKPGYLHTPDSAVLVP
jgi:DNA-binding beta-propeller fold protein YncE